ncbi:MAG: hypothetical protein K0Q90_1809 [Paenibacillaceae bacterium]|nr:hypothetical protein [Paenibacillaceae bacterium]
MVGNRCKPLVGHYPLGSGKAAERIQLSCLIGLNFPFFISRLSGGDSMRRWERSKYPCLKLTKIRNYRAIICLAAGKTMEFCV